MPRSLATCATGRPDSKTSRTPRSSSSSGYLRGLAIVAEHSFRPGHHPGPRGLRETRDGSVAQLSEGLSRDVAPSERTTDRNDESPANAGLSRMRRRGLEPPPGYPGPGPQPGASTNSAIGAREGEYSPGARGLESVRDPL